MCLAAVASGSYPFILAPRNPLHPIQLSPLLQGLLRPENLPAKCEQGLFELAFVFACVWAFGGALGEKDGVKYRQQFDKWWKVRGGGGGRVGRVETHGRAGACLQCWRAVDLSTIADLLAAWCAVM